MIANGYKRFNSEMLHFQSLNITQEVIIWPIYVTSVTDAYVNLLRHSCYSLVVQEGQELAGLPRSQQRQAATLYALRTASIHPFPVLHLPLI